MPCGVRLVEVGGGRMGVGQVGGGLVNEELTGERGVEWFIEVVPLATDILEGENRENTRL